MSSIKESKRRADSEPRVPKRGEVWWITQNPVIPKDPHLPRPAVIISTNPRNRTWASIVVVPFSTSLENPYPPFHKFIPKGEGGLAVNSYARCDLVSNIEKNCLDTRGPLGPTLSEKFIWEIVRGIRATIGDNPDF
jgi:mRNA-degrading endonuclease toxin of MazEF toxin-antitoxin module